VAASPQTDPRLPASLSVGLKEWDVLCRSLAEGRQIFILRKGGIVERGDGFSLDSKEFVLLPTHEHQNGLDVKPAFQSLLQPGPGPEGPFDVSCAARAEDVRILTPAQAKNLLPFSIWTEAFLEKRLAYQPSRPLYMVVLRVYSRPAAARVPADKRYAGCLSWVVLNNPVAVADFTPVLPAADFESRRREILAALT
jgi:hypothetical protein